MWIHSRIRSSRDLAYLQLDRTKQEAFVFSFFLHEFTPTTLEESEMKIKSREENDRSKELTELTVDQNYGHLAHANFSRLHPRRNSRLGIEQHVHGLTYASCEWLRKWELRRLEEGNCNGRWKNRASRAFTTLPGTI